MLTDRDLAPLMQDFYATVLDREEQLRLLGRRGGDDAHQQAQIQRWTDVGEQARRDLAMSRFDSVDFIAAALIKKHGLSGKLDDIEVRQVQQAMLRTSVDVADAMKARFQGEFTHEPRDRLLKLEIVAADHPSPQRPTPEDPRPESARNGGALFIDVAEAFRLRQIDQEVWENQTASQAKATFRLFVEHCGNRPLSGYLRSDAASFKDMLLELPVSYSRSPEFQGMTGAQILIAAKGDGESRLNARTVQRHLAALSRLWQDAIDAEQATTNIFSGFKLPRVKKAHEQRNMWSPDKLQKLFDSPVWRGCASDARRASPGSLVIRDEQFWLPLIALFSGLRLEEISRLRLGDIRQETGVWVFDANTIVAKKGIKSPSGVRVVPIHSKLLQIGLLDYLELARQAGNERLFYQLSPGGADKKFGHGYSKTFGRYRRRVGLYERFLDFHSLRHSATTFMMQNNASPPVVDYITGHVRQGETARYTKGFRISQLKDTIELIDPEIDLDHLLP